MRASLPVGNTSAGRPSGDWFGRLAMATAKLSGKPATFILATGTILIWAITGPIFHYSDTWQLVINTGTTIITFLMVFLIQATQNRDTTALQLKLDELIIATKNARNEVAGIEEAAEHVIEATKTDMKRRADHN
jgi:low affinity Fe/Cu permease